MDDYKKEKLLDTDNIQEEKHPEYGDLEAEITKHEVYKNKLELKHAAEDGEYRKECAKFVQKITIYCLFSVLGLLILNAINFQLDINTRMVSAHLNIDFNISDKVMITILTATTANILGLFAIVLKYFYGSFKKY